MPIASVRVAITLDDGTLEVMRFLTQGVGNAIPLGARQVGVGAWIRDPSPENIAAEVTKTYDTTGTFIEGIPFTRPQPVRWRVISEADIPASREFRFAWTDLGAGAITHDLAKVKVLAVERLRQNRDALLAQLDGQWMAATGQGKGQAAIKIIEDKRQALRDAPQVYLTALASATTVDQIKAAKPILSA